MLAKWTAVVLAHWLDQQGETKMLYEFFFFKLEIFSRKIVGCYGREPILPLNYIFNEIFPHVCIYGFINKNTCFVFLGEFYDPNEDDENDDED